MDASERERLRRWADPYVVRQDAELFTPNDVVPPLDALDAAEAERDEAVAVIQAWFPLMHPSLDDAERCVREACQRAAAVLRAAEARAS